MRPKRLLTAVFAGLLLVCGIPGAALAETDVVLSNESEGTEVNTGDSTFTNNQNTSSGSTSFSTQTPGDATTGAAAVGQVAATVPSSAAPAAAEAAEAEAAQAVDESVEALFVGFSIADGSISP